MFPVKRSLRWMLPLGACLGGCGEDVAVEAAEVPAEPTWVKIEPMRKARVGHASVALPGGRVLVLGGFGDSGDSVALDGVEIYDPHAETWTELAPMKHARAYFEATLLRDGRVLVTGGTDGPAKYLDAAEIYDPEGHGSKALPPMERPHVAHTATLSADETKVVLIGGRGDDSKDILEIYDIAAEQFSLAPVPAELAVHGHTATLLPSGLILVAGGYDPKRPLSEAFLVDPARHDAYFHLPLSGMAEPRSYPVAARLPEACPDETASPEWGNVLVVGGAGPVHGRARSAEIFDWRTGKWRDPAPPEMTTPRSNAAGDLLGGYFVITGGETPSSQGHSKTEATRSVERYDPCAWAWSSLPDLHDARRDHSVNVLDDGRLFVSGGFGEGDAILHSVEVLWLNAACASQYDCSEGNVCSAGRCVERGSP